MKLADKVKFITSILEDLYPEPDIPLNHKNNFTFLVAVMLSAQSTDKKVNEITPKLFQIANTAKEMNKLEMEQIKEIIREIGLAPTKAPSFISLNTFQFCSSRSYIYHSSCNRLQRFFWP